MYLIHSIRRPAGILLWLAGALPASLIAAAPAALATPRPKPPGWNKHRPLPAHVHAAVTGGMPGWQITLIAAAAALVAAALAVMVYRARSARRRATVSAA